MHHHSSFQNHPPHPRLFSNPTGETHSRTHRSTPIHTRPSRSVSRSAFPRDGPRGKLGARARIALPQLRFAARARENPRKELLSSDAGTVIRTPETGACIITSLGGRAYWCISEIGWATRGWIPSCFPRYFLRIAREIFRDLIREDECYTLILIRSR